MGNKSQNPLPPGLGGPPWGLANTFKAQESAAQMGAIPYASLSSMFLAHPLLSTATEDASHACHLIFCRVDLLVWILPKKDPVEG